jgi:integrase
VVVYQRGNKYAYRLELDRDPLTNERQFEYETGFTTYDQALTAAVKAKASHAKGQRVAPDKRTLAGFMTEWLDTVRDSIKPSTHANYVDYWDAYVLPKIGKRQLQEVNVPMLNALYRHLLSEGRCKPDNNTVMYEYWSTRRVAGAEPGPSEIAKHCKVSIYAAKKAVLRYRRGRAPVAKSAGLAPKTVKNVHRMLHRALADAVAWRYIEYNPAEHAALPREKRKGSRQRGATWTQEQLAAWLKVAVQDRDAGMWVLAATTGMRRSELAGAERDLLDLDSATLEIADTRVVVDGKAEDSDGKSESGRRTISLDPVTVAYLRRHVAMLEEEQKSFGASYQDNGKLMCFPNGKLLHPGTVTNRFNKLVDRAGVPRIRLHDVRHTYATLSLDSGVDPKIVSDRIGHANMAYTLTIYTHRSTGRDKGAAEKVAGVIFGDDWEGPPEQDDGAA